MIQAILFDFNGVIINDEPLQMKAYQEVLGAEGITLTKEDYYSSLGMDDRTFVRAACARHERTLTDDQMRELIERKSKEHRELIREELPFFPGVITFIKAAARHYSTGLVSMARRTEIDHVLERAGLDGYFDVIISAEDVTACKPDPACYRQAFKGVDEKRHASGLHLLSPEDCLAIEDAPPGIRAARGAGMRTLGVTNTVSDAALREAGADVVTASLADWTTDAVRHVFT